MQKIEPVHSFVRRFNPVKCVLTTLLLLTAASINAQMNWADRFEVEGGIDLAFAAKPQGDIRDYRATTRPGFGYRMGFNFQLFRQYRFNGLRSSLSVGLVYNTTNFELSEFSNSEEGVILTSNGTESSGPVRQIEGTAEASARSWGCQLLLRTEVSDHFAPVLGLLFLDRRSGEVSFDRTYTDSHFYDPGRQIWVPAAEATSFDVQNAVTGSNAFRMQVGLEYYDWFDGAYAKLMLEGGVANGAFQFSTGHLTLLLGYRF